MCHKLVWYREHLLVLWIKFRCSTKWKKNTNCMHEYIYPYRMLPGAILEFYKSVTMYLTHNIRKNKVNIDIEFLLHVNDGDRCGIFWYCYWVIKLGSQSCSYTPRKKTRISSNFQTIVTSCVLFIAVSSNCFSLLWLFSLSSDWNYHQVGALHNIYTMYNYRSLLNYDVR